MKLIGFMLRTDVLISAQMLYMARSLWFFCTFIWSVSGWRLLGKGWKKSRCPSSKEPGPGLEGVWSSHPWHFPTHLLPEDIILFLFENCLCLHFLIKHSDFRFSGCFNLQLMWLLTILPFYALFPLLSLLGIHGRLFSSSLKIFKDGESIIHSFNIYWMPSTGKAVGYNTDKISTFMGLMFWSGKKVNKQTNKQANLRLKECCEGMEQDDRMERNLEVRVTLYEVVKESLSEVTTVKLRWRKSILERETDKCKGPEAGKSWAVKGTGQRPECWVCWVWGGEARWSQRGGQGPQLMKPSGFLTLLWNNFFKSLSKGWLTKNLSLGFVCEFWSPLWTTGQKVCTSCPLTWQALVKLSYVFLCSKGYDGEGEQDGLIQISLRWISLAQASRLWWNLTTATAGISKSHGKSPKLCLG